ncbi:MAG: DNA-processing protein DprA [Candidatus Falkowbacteria bacterium]
MREYFVAFNCFSKIGPVRTKRLLDFFGNLELAYKATRENLIQAKIETKIVDEFVVWRQTFDLEKYLGRLEKEDIKYVTILDEDYPPLLFEIYGPPPLLYYRGTLECKGYFPLAVIGARKYSPYGERVVNEIIPSLINNKFCIISGLARGIDSLVHRATLLAEGKTWAVLGSGLDWKSIYPPENITLAREIINSDGAVFSEFPLGTAPLPINFPLRNRIVAGMSKGTLVIEARQKSGALITATYALEQNREVLAVPGNIFLETSAGPNDLIKSGAKVVTSANDILELFAFVAGPEKNVARTRVKPELDEMEEKIYVVLSDLPMHINEIAQATKLDTKNINSTLSMLELRGIIKNTGAGEYVLN